MNNQTTTTKQDQKFDAAAYINKHGSKSQAIRALDKEGKTRGEIAKLLGLRYQHVRNVLITPVKNPKTK